LPVGRRGVPGYPDRDVTPLFSFPGARAMMMMAVGSVASALALAPRIQVLPHPVAPRVDVSIAEQPFTSYLYLTAMPRPALLSLRTPGGTLVDGTEDAAEGDEPAGFWFAHGSVNGVNFATTARTPRAARIVHRRVVEAVSSDTAGRLAVQSAWTAADQSVVLLEDTYFTFDGGDERRTIDRVTRLAAINGPVRLGSTERGLAGLRFAGGFLDREAIAGSAAGEVQRMPCAGARGRWLAVPAVRDGRRITVAIFDHPHNPGHPNELRCSVRGLEIVPGSETPIDAGSSVSFRYRLVLAEGAVEAAAVETAYREWYTAESLKH
jgi:hypothetical protein